MVGEKVPVLETPLSNRSKKNFLVSSTLGKVGSTSEKQTVVELSVPALVVLLSSITKLIVISLLPQLFTSVYVKLKFPEVEFGLFKKLKSLPASVKEAVLKLAASKLEIPDSVRISCRKLRPSVGLEINP